MRLTVKQPRKEGFVSQRLRAYIDLIRPFTLLAPMFGGMFGVLIAMKCNGIAVTWEGLGLVIYVAVTLMFLNAGSNCLNQWTDVREDAVNKRYRPLTSGLIERRDAWWLAVFCFGTAIFRGLWISPMFVLLVSIIMLFSITYSLWPRMKRVVFLGNVWIGVPRGLLGLLAAYSAVAWPPHPLVLGAGVFLAVYTTGAITTKDFGDLDGDRKARVRNLVTVLGPLLANVVSMLVVLVSVAVFYFVSGVTPLLYVAAVGVLVTFFVMMKPRIGEDNVWHENGLAWVTQYCVIMGMFIALWVVV